MAKSRIPKTLKKWHTSSAKTGSGDYYGTAHKNPLGKMREGTGMYEVTPAKLKKPPKSLA